MQKAPDMMQNTTEPVQIVGEWMQTDDERRKIGWEPVHLGAVAVPDAGGRVHSRCPRWQLLPATVFSTGG